MNYQILPIQPQYDQAICKIIKSVGQEFGAIGDGFGPSDEEVLHMSVNYSGFPDRLYLVAVLDGKVIGGGGIAPFSKDGEICELRKLFLLPEARGVGIGKAITLKCLDFATEAGFKKCYLDTLSNMKVAISIYEKLGFKKLKEPLEDAIHNGCDIWMLKDLT